MKIAFLAALAVCIGFTAAASCRADVIYTFSDTTTPGAPFSFSYDSGSTFVSSNAPTGLFPCTADGGPQSCAFYPNAFNNDPSLPYDEALFDISGATTRFFFTSGALDAYGTYDSISTPYSDTGGTLIVANATPPPSVPEPASFWLLATGLTGAAGQLLRRRLSRQ